MKKIDYTQGFVETLLITEVKNVRVSKRIECDDTALSFKVDAEEDRKVIELEVSLKYKINDRDYIHHISKTVYAVNTELVDSLKSKKGALANLLIQLAANAVGHSRCLFNELNWPLTEKLPRDRFPKLVFIDTIDPKVVSKLCAPGSNRLRSASHSAAA